MKLDDGSLTRFLRTGVLGFGDKLSVLRAALPARRCSGQLAADRTAASLRA